MKRAAGIALALALAGVAVARAEPPPGWNQPPEQQGQIEASKLSKVPVQTRFVEATYPKEAFEKGIEADVILLLDIDEQGKVTQVGIQQPADPPDMGFDEEAMVAAQQFEFEPAELDGKRIAVQITYRYRFTLKNKQTPAETGPPATGDAAGGKAAEPARKPVVNLAGVLLERGTRTRMAGVVVTVFRDDLPDGPLGYEAATASDGSFTFYDLQPGTWKVLAEPPGYYPFRTSEDIPAGQRVDVTYYLEKGSYNPYDVTVTAERPRKEVSRTVIEAGEIDKVPGGAGDPLNVVLNFAGVARTQSPALLVVRGSAPEDSRTFIDGATVPLLYHFGGLKSVVPIGILESIEFYPGNFSPMYGRATGGIIDVRIKELKPERVGGYADVSLLDTGVYLEVPVGKRGAVAVAGRRSYIDGVLNLAVPSDAPVSLVTAPVYYDLQALGNFRPSPAHDLRGLFMFSDDRLELLFDNPADLDPELRGNRFETHTGFYRTLLTYRYVPSTRFENTARVSQGRDRLEFGAGQLAFDLGVYTAQMRDQVHQKLGERVALNYGADVLFQQIDAYIAFPLPPKEGEPQGGNFDIGELVTTNVEDARFWSPAAYAEVEIKPVPELLIVPGLRADYFQRVDQAAVQPRATARWQLSPEWTVKGGTGLFVQEPDLDETNDNFGNPELETERTIHYSAGAELRPTSWITLDATGFYKHMWHLVSPTDRLEMGEGGEMDPVLFDNGGRGRVYGLELVARHEFRSNLTGWIAYTLSRAERRDTDAMDERLFDFDQTHILTTVVSYLLPRNWLVGGRFRLVSGNPTTPVVGAVYNASADEYQPMFGAVNSGRNPSFNQLDLRVDKRWIYRNWIFNAYLDIQNVYNRANAEGVEYNFDYTESRPQQGVPLITIIGLRAEF